MRKRWKQLLAVALAALVAGSGIPAGQALAAEDEAPALLLSGASGLTLAANGLPKASGLPLKLVAGDAKKGSLVTVSANPVDGYYLAQLRCAYQKNGAIVYDVIPAEEEAGTDPYAVEAPAKAEFQLPADTVTVYADYISVIWDGTVDLTWYDPDQTDFALSWPAQLEGAAVLCAGLFNDMPTREVKQNGKSIRIPDLVDEKGQAVGLDTEIDKKKIHGRPAGADGSGYQVFADLDGDGYPTTLVGDLSLVDAYNSKADSAGSNNVTSSDNYWYGAEDFTGKTLRLTRDLDMGGVCSGNKLLLSSWTGPNYMPLGGGYSMDPANGLTRLSAGFNGSLDGGGHMVYNLFANRHVTTGFGNCQGCGLVGMLGLNQIEFGKQVKPAVRNLAVDGFVYGNRMVGGIVGQTMHSKGALIENCMNFATVYNTDAKGCAGILGNGLYSSAYGDRAASINNCANFGYICTGYNKNAGGLVGLSDALVYNSYTTGFAAGERISSQVAGKTVEYSNIEAGNTFGTNDGGAVWINCYGLDGGSTAKKDKPGVTTPLVYGSTAGSAMRSLSALSEMKKAGFASLLNGRVRTGAADQNGYLASDQDLILDVRNDWVQSGSGQTYASAYLARALQLSAFWHNPASQVPEKASQAQMAGYLTQTDLTGVPIPAVFLQDRPAVKELKMTGSPKLSYLSNESFSAGGPDARQAESPADPADAEFAVWAIYDDGSYSQLDDYQVIYPSGASRFAASDKSVTIRASAGGITKEWQFAVTVTEAVLLEFSMTKEPDSTLYGKGEHFNPNGLTVNAAYGLAENPANPSKEIKVIWENGVPVISEWNASMQAYEKLAEDAALPYMDQGVFSFSPGTEAELSTDVSKVTLSHSWGGKTMRVDIPLQVLSTDVARGERSGGKNVNGNSNVVVKDSDKNTVYIENTDAFLWFVNQVNTEADPAMWAVLECDLDLSDLPLAPIGMKSDKTVMYRGTFDGNGHSIKLAMDRSDQGIGTNGMAALFYGLEEDGVVKNLTLHGSVRGGDQAAGIALKLSGGTISGCLNQAEIISGSGKAAGGILAESLSGTGLVDHCENAGSVTGGGSKKNGAGGIVGNLTGKGSGISACKNTGAVWALDSGWQEETAVGGIAGIVGDSGLSVFVKDCENRGAVSGLHRVAAGGIAGAALSANAAIENCVQLGSLTVEGLAALRAKVAAGTSDWGGAGGILGRAVKGCGLKSCYSAGGVFLTEDGTPADQRSLPTASSDQLLLLDGEAIGAAGCLAGQLSDLSGVKGNYVLSPVAEGSVESLLGPQSRAAGDLKDANIAFTGETDPQKAIAAGKNDGKTSSGTEDSKGAKPAKKKAQPMTVKVKKKTFSVKASALKKAKKKLSKKTVFTIKKNQGTVSFKKLSGSKKLSISKKGLVSVKKGTKKGTYQMKVKVTAAGNKSYRSGAKTVSIKVKVK